MPSPNRLILKTSAAGMEKQLWTITDDRCVVLTATIQWLPDNSLDIHAINIIDSPAESVLAEAALLLLNRSVRFATDRELRFVRVVEWQADGSLSTSAMDQAGFAVAGVIHEWVLEEGPASLRSVDPRIRRTTLTPSASFSAFPATDVIPAVPRTPHTETVLTELVRGCLAESGDLVGLPSPVPHLILKGWKALPGSVDAIILEDGGRDVGLGVLSRRAPEFPVTLEYLGVTSCARRQGHATRLIDAILTGVFCTDESSRAPVPPRIGLEPKNRGIIAFCDSDNSVAVKLYRERGFVRGQAGTIHVRLI